MWWNGTIRTVLALVCQGGAARRGRLSAPASVVVLAATLAALALPGNALAACDTVVGNLAQNCSFEQPAVADGTFVAEAPGSNLGGWIVAPTGDSVDLTNKNFVGAYPVAAGLQSVDLNHGDRGGLYQDIATTPGQPYRLTFSLSGYPAPQSVCPAADPKTLTVTAGSASQSFSFSPDTTASPPGNQRFDSKTLDFVGATASTTTRVSFASTTDLCAGPIIDDVTVVPVTPPDGAGTLTTPTSAVTAGSAGNTITFTYTAGPQGIASGAVTISVPGSGLGGTWSAPSTSPTAPGSTTASRGSVSVSGDTITVSGVSLDPGGTFTIAYGSRAGGGPGATAPSFICSPEQVWQAREKSTAAGTLTALASSPSITLLAPDGSGQLTADTTTVRPASTGNTIAFAYAPDSCGGAIVDGMLTLVVPAGWSAPSTNPADPGYASASVGTLSVSGRTITVSGVSQGVRVVYGDKTGGGPGATAPGALGAQEWLAQAKSSPAGTLTGGPFLRAVIDVEPAGTAPDGSGTMTPSFDAVAAASHLTQIDFTYVAAPGGMRNGTVTLTVPAGWTAPTTTKFNPRGCRILTFTHPPEDCPNAGYVQADAGTASVAGRTIVVSGVTLDGGQSLTIHYGQLEINPLCLEGSATTGASAAACGLLVATGRLGPQTWLARQKTTPGGTLKALAHPPVITVFARDGAGTLTTPTKTARHDSTGNTLVFTYKVPAGGFRDGTVALGIPEGWSIPSTRSTDPGFAVASTGTLSVSGPFTFPATRRTDEMAFEGQITVSGVTLAAGKTLTITYGAKSAGGPGATAPTTAGISNRVTLSGGRRRGPQIWLAEASSVGGDVVALAHSPSIAVR